MMRQVIYQVDSFTDAAFAGNPAGVCVTQAPAEEPWMRAIAREMNLSATAFLCSDGDGFNLRWFTPAVEVDLCGHATLASAHILWEKGMIDPTVEVRFATRSGILKAAPVADLVRLDFPARPPAPAEPSDNLIAALGVDPVHIQKNRSDYLIEVESEQVVRSVTPDFGTLVRTDARAVIVTARSSTEQYDFVSRFFAPAVGINEDPVTGSAHCVLGPYWKKRLNKNVFRAFQASERGGEVKIQLQDDRILLLGKAVSVFEITVL